MPKAPKTHKSDGQGFDLVDDFGFDDLSESIDGIDLRGDYTPERDSPEDSVEYSDSYERDTKAELDAIKKDFSELDKQRKQATKTIEASRDTDYAIQVIFLDHKQRDAFLEQSGWHKHGKRYVNGLELAKAMGIELPESNFRPPKPRTDKTLSAFALDLEDL